jgi:hypothetical protein
MSMSVHEIGVITNLEFVGINKTRGAHWSAEPAVIELAALCCQTNFDVSKALAIGQLGEGHGEKLIPTSEALRVSVPIETLNAPAELVVRKKLHDLSKYGLSLVHGIPPCGISLLPRGPKNQENISNRLRSFWPASFSLSYGYSFFQNAIPDSSDRK